MNNINDFEILQKIKDLEENIVSLEEENKSIKESLKLSGGG